MPANFIKSFFNVISTIGFLNFVFLLCSMFVLLNTGELVLEGKIYPGETFESDFALNDTNDLTLIIHAVNSESTELLNINIMNSDGDVVFSEEKRFTISRSSDDPPGTVKSTYDTRTIFTPETPGKYHISVTGAEFPTDLEIKSGKINPEKSSYFIPSMFISFVIGFLASMLGSKRRTKIQFLIALPISLIITIIVLFVI